MALTLTMVGRLDPCVLLAYRTPAAAVRGLVPAPLELVTRDGYAYWHVVVCRVQRMRPAALPALFGMTYAHVAYRLAVRCGDAEGLFFVRSDVDSAAMALGGNMMTDFRFHASPVRLSEDGGALEVRVDGEASARVVTSPGGGELDPWLAYRPLALSVRRGVVRLARVERDAACWREEPVAVRGDGFGFIEAPGPVELARASRVAPIDYRWTIGEALPSSSASRARPASATSVSTSGAWVR